MTGKVTVSHWVRMLWNGDKVVATIRRVLGALLLTTLLGVAGSTLGAAAVSATTRMPAAGSATPGVPTSTTGVMGEHFVRYCVKNYAPDSTVTVTNERTGATVTIHTNGNGAGCAEVPIKRGCRAVRQVIVASGIDANGKPASSRAVVVAPPTPSLCQAAAQHNHGSGAGSGTGSGSLAFTGATGIMMMLAIGIVLIIVGSAALAAARRRRAHGAY